MTVNELTATTEDIYCSLRELTDKVGDLLEEDTSPRNNLLRLALRAVHRHLSAASDRLEEHLD